MKKTLCLLLCLCLAALCAAGCAGQSPPPEAGSLLASITGEAKPQRLAADAAASAAGAPPPAAGASGPETLTPGVDVDLTALSSTMVYAEVYNMMVNPADYLGKVVKMRGAYYASYYDVTQEYYHYVIVKDATACCQQGLEFIWNGRHRFPEDYPADYTEVEMQGVFGSYEELSQTYYYLAVDEIVLV